LVESPPRVEGRNMVMMLTPKRLEPLDKTLKPGSTAPSAS
jgi:hypothetical protein